MRTLIRVHELVNDVCKHCGGTKPGPESTCIPRMWDGAPEPERRVPSVESYDFIGARLAELEAERKAAEAKGGE